VDITCCFVKKTIEKLYYECFRARYLALEAGRLALNAIKGLMDKVYEDVYLSIKNNKALLPAMPDVGLAGFILKASRSLRFLTRHYCLRCQMWG